MFLPKAAIFDLDGTLLDSMWIWEKLDAKFLEMHGITVTPDYTDAIKSMTWEDGARYTIDRYGLSETPQQVIDAWLDLAKEAYMHEVELKKGAREYLELLSSHHVPMAVATSMYPKENIGLILEHNGILQYFQNITHSSEVTKDKSHPDIYLLAAERLSAEPSSCAVFEDILPAIQGALKGGFQTVAIFDSVSRNDWEEIQKTATKAVMSFEDLLL